MKAFKSSVIYFFGTVLEKGLAFLLIPLYTHYLSTADYGILNILQSLIAVLIILFSLSLSGAASRFHFDGKALYKQLHYGNIFTFVTLFSILGAFTFWLIKGKIFSLLGNVPLYPYVYFVIIISYGGIVFSIYQLMLQMEHKAFEYIKNDLLRFFLSSVLSIYFVVYLLKKADGVLLASSLVYIFFIIYIFYNLKRKKIKLNLNKKLIKKNISYSIYLVPHNLAGILNSFLDRFYISNMLNLSNVGIYALAGQLSGVLGIFSTAINRALTPAILKAYKNENYNYLIKLANIVIIFITVMALILSVFSYEIVNIIAPKNYKNANLVISILSFYAVVQMYYYMTCGVLFYEKKATKFIAIATGLSLLLNFIFNYFFIKLWGIKGAAVATLLSIIVVNYLVIFIANKFIIVGFEHKKIHFIIISGFLVANLCYDFAILIKIFIVFFTIFIFLFMEKDNFLLKDLLKKIKHR